MYSSILKSSRFRGVFNVIYDTGYNLGIIFTFLLAQFCDLFDQAKYLIALPIIFTVLFAAVPDTPQHLIRIGEVEKAERAQAFFCGTELTTLCVTDNTIDNPKLELNDFSELKEQMGNGALCPSPQTKQNHFSFVTANRRARKAIVIALSLTCLYSLQGMMILNNFVTEIFSSTKLNIPPLFASIITTSMLIIAILIYMNLVYRFDRRTLYVCSSMAVTAGLTTFAVYLYFFAESETFDWVPLYVSLTRYS